MATARHENQLSRSPLDAMGGRSCPSGHTVVWKERALLCHCFGEQR
jgi:hypothetical protein